jgi:phosphoglycolate phosphatase
MTTSPRAIVFDLDGTLVDTARDIAAALDRLLVELGYRPVGMDVARGLIGGGARLLVERGLALVGAAGKHDGATLALRWLDIYEEAIARHSVPYPGVGATLTHLAKAGARLGVCTIARPSSCSTLWAWRRISRRSSAATCRGASPMPPI